LAAGAGAVVAYVVLIRTATGQQLENMALRGARQEFEGIRQSSLVELHEITTVAFAVAIALVMVVALLRRKPRLAVMAAGVMGISVAVAEVAKRVLPRPELVDAPPGWLNNSFPSGHVTIAVAIGVGAIIVAPYAFRWLVTIVAALYAMGIAQAVEIAGWHRLSGVIGATLLVLAVASVGLFVMARMGRIQAFGSRRLVGAVVATVVLGLVGLGFAGVGAVFGLGRLLPLPAAPTAGDELLAFTSTLLVGAGLIALVLLAFLWLIRPYGIDEETSEV
jgi:hypothetical protein